MLLNNQRIKEEIKREIKKKKPWNKWKWAYHFVIFFLFVTSVFFFMFPFLPSFGSFE